MNILVYGDSNTWGYVPDATGYKNEDKCGQYPTEFLWWYPLVNKHTVNVNALCGHAINNENQWLDGRNAIDTIEQDLAGYNNLDLIILQLGTNDCKEIYNLTPKLIIEDLSNLIQKIQNICDADIMIISPAKIMENNPHTKKYYKGGSIKSRVLNTRYEKLANELGLYFVSGFDAEVGEDGEHLSPIGHAHLGSKVLEMVNNIEKSKNKDNEKII